MTQNPKDFYVEEPMETDEQSNSQPNNGVNKTLYAFYSDIMLASGQPIPQTLNALQIELFLKTNLLPFLRSVALFFHFLTNVSPPQRLKDSTITAPNPTEEYDILCHYLGLSPKFSLLLESSSMRQLALIWARHPRVHLIVSHNTEAVESPIENPPKLVVQPHAINRLVDLPNDYSDLINSVAQFTCPNSDGDDSRSPTMCLVWFSSISPKNESFIYCFCFVNRSVEPYYVRTAIAVKKNWTEQWLGRALGTLTSAVPDRECS